MSQRTPLEHLIAVRELVGAPATRTVSLADALGATLALDVRTQVASPPFDNSQMDGFAVPKVGERSWPVGPTVAAGSVPAALDGRACPVMTGAPIPEGTAAIVPVEHCEPPHFEAAEVRVPEVPEGQFIRLAGSDARVGTLIASAGTRVTPLIVAAAASQAMTELEVIALKVLIIAGGAEVGGTGPASIPDANGPLLRALSRSFGFEVVGQVYTDDNPQALSADLVEAITTLKPDVVVTSGGISRGRFEVVRQLLEPTGWFGHVAQQPGGPQGVATFHGVPVVCLPGNPISTLVSFRMFVAPALSGRRDFGGTTAAFAGPDTVRGITGKVQFRRGVLRDGKAEILGQASSHLLVQGAQARVLIEVPAGGEIAPGDTVNVYPLEELEGEAS